MQKSEIESTFLKALHIYMSKVMSTEKAIEQAGLVMARNEFLRLMRVAYERNLIVVRSPIDRDMCDKLQEWSPHRFRITTCVVNGNPDDTSFYLAAAEQLLTFLTEPLLDKNIDTINIGIVSGSSTTSMVEHLVESGFWEQIVGGHEVHTKHINVIALNATPVVGWELKGNANIAVTRLSVMLQDKLRNCIVRPFGISTDLVVKHAELPNVDNMPQNRSILEISDPGRLDPTHNKSSGLNFVITGVGTPENSVFKRVLDSEGIAAPQQMVGDVACSPVDQYGKELELKKDGERYMVYSAISLKTMRYLAEKEGTTVMLIARNSRRGEAVDKARAIRAAIRGKYVNAIFTDAHTASSVIKK
ncbi:MAG: sugar-binding transcriptional regulator [Planctomycetota bacterium]|jgi:DNA-binding transcriptional regulator LsrR (DeoR family)